MKILKSYNLGPGSKVETSGIQMNKEAKRLFLKRPFDIVLSLTGLIVSFPIWVTIAAAVWLEDGGPIFYRQIRLGKSGRVFKLFKFRSMIQDAEQQTGAVWANKEDHRITKVGGFLRRTALDELPQLINILKGDMSFVGPRAERPEIVKEILEGIPEFSDRLLVLPGLTGLAQVHGNYNTPPRKKLRYDNLYIRNQSFWLDLKLILVSFWITFRFKWSEREKRAERQIGQIMLDAGVISHEHLKNALEHQRIWGGKIGESLIQLKYISPSELRHFLNLQVVHNGKGNWIGKNKNHDKRKLIGQILLESGIITEEQLMVGLENQKKWGGRIGENLIGMGYISKTEMEHYLNKQLEINMS